MITGTELIKVTNGVQFEFPTLDIETGLRMYREISEVIESITLADVDPSTAVLKVKIFSEGMYEVSPQGCQISGYTARKPLPSPIPQKVDSRDFQGGVELVARDILKGPIKVALYFNPKSQA